jgi:hypothetical protein
MTPTAQLSQELASLVHTSRLAKNATITLNDGVGAEDESLLDPSCYLSRLSKGQGLGPALRPLGERSRFLSQAGDDPKPHSQRPQKDLTPWRRGRQDDHNLL